MAQLPVDNLLEYVRATRGFDFKGYKRASLERRILKRMGAVGIDSYDAYVDYLEVHPDEFPELFNTILINVTGFFRDPASWTVTEQALRARLDSGAGNDGRAFRAWSAGCASGEEACSIVMMLAEMIGEDAVSARVKVYATDVDEETLAQARQSRYSARQIEALPAGYADKYFNRARGRYELKKELRRCLIFGRHDLIHDAPISRIDLLTCRNTLMYLNAETQEKIVKRLEFALNPGGILMLGKAEMLLAHWSLFSPIDLKRRVFTKAAGDDRDRLAASSAPRVREAEGALPHHVRLGRQAFDVSPTPEIAVDAHNVLAFANLKAREEFGLSARDLGRPIQDLEISYRPIELRTAIEQALAERRLVVLKDVERTRAGAEPVYYDIHVTPLNDGGGPPLGVQVSFVDVTRAMRLHIELRHANRALEEAHEELQSTSEELETTNEELQSTIEELETTNEELQSTNEELETMNEELQSTNEEQQASNRDLRIRSDELDKVNVFFETILATMRAAIIVIDRDYSVQVWNREAEELWGMRGSEVRGKKLIDLDIGFPVAEIGASLRAAFEGTALPSDQVVEARNRRGRLIRCAVAVTRLVGDTDARGALLVVTELESPPERDAVDKTART